MRNTHPTVGQNALVLINGDQGGFTGSFAQDIDQPRRLDLNIGDLRIGDKDGLRRPAKPDQDTVTDFEVDRSGGFANNLICLNRSPHGSATRSMSAG